MPAGFGSASSAGNHALEEELVVAHMVKLFIGSVLNSSKLFRVLRPNFAGLYPIL